MWVRGQRRRTSLRTEPGALAKRGSGEHSKVTGTEARWRAGDWPCKVPSPHQRTPRSMAEIWVWGLEYWGLVSVGPQSTPSAHASSKRQSKGLGPGAPVTSLSRSVVSLKCLPTAGNFGPSILIVVASNLYDRKLPRSFRSRFSQAYGLGLMQREAA